jgi:hypothetical protein
MGRTRGGPSRSIRRREAGIGGGAAPHRSHRLAPRARDATRTPTSGDPTRSLALRISCHASPGSADIGARLLPKLLVKRGAGGRGRTDDLPLTRSRFRPPQALYQRLCRPQPWLDCLIWRGLCEFHATRHATESAPKKPARGHCGCGPMVPCNRCDRHPYRHLTPPPPLRWICGAAAGGSSQTPDAAGRPTLKAETQDGSRMAINEGRRN